MASLFKNGHFKNVHFRKIATQIYTTVFGGNYNCGNIIRLSQVWVMKIHCNPIIIVHEYIRIGRCIVCGGIDMITTE